MIRDAGRLPSLNALRAFEVSSRHLNFRVAAEELGVTQGAVAQLVRGLEADLGIRLFDRLARSLALTDQGRTFAASIHRAFELIAEATATLLPEPLRLTISVTPTFASKWLIPRLSEFTAANPDLELGIVASDRMANFQTDGVDIAVRYGKPPFGSNVTGELLFEQEVVAVCSPGLASGRVSRWPPDLSGFVLLHDAHNLWPEFMEKALGLSPAGTSKGVRFSQTSLAIDAALGGHGVALAADFFVEQDLAAGRLVRLFDLTMRAANGFYVVTPRKPRHPSSTATVRDWLLAHRSSDPNDTPA